MTVVEVSVGKLGSLFADWHADEVLDDLEVADYANRLLDRVVEECAPCP